ncbi:MAG: hypothetical protein ACE5I1_31175 [bacterium]
MDTYRQDFKKYTRKFQVKYIDTLFNFAPTVAGRKFKYNEVPGSYRKRELIPALNLLVKAGVVHKIIPIEVKSGSPGTLKSMRIFLNEHKNSPFGIRFSGLNYAADNQLYSYPLYAVACVIDSSKALAGLLRGFLEE